MPILYNLAIQSLWAGMRIAASGGHAKIRQGVMGRNQWRKYYRAAIPVGKKICWIHVASLGEFEQGRPVIEAFRESNPDWCIVLTFFSPSGYEMRKNYPHAHFIGYLPLDTRRNARDFLDIVQPDIAIFVKYEFWANYLLALKARKIPTLLIASLFRPEQPFFRFYGTLWRRMLHCFTHIFTQTNASAQLLRDVGFQQITVAGDTRIDRVLQIAAHAPEHPIVQHFVKDHLVIVMGSSWAKDEDLMLEALPATAGTRVKVICAPHTPTPAHVTRLRERLGARAITYSALMQAPEQDTAHFQWLIIDNIGMLNTLYRYGHIAYIGGGFGAGIHNTLEPAAYALPVIFGPRYHKFEEARQLIQCEGGFVAHHRAGLEQVLGRLMEPEYRQHAAAAARNFLEQNQGGTRAVLDYLDGIGA